MRILAELTPLDPVDETRKTVRAASAQDRNITGLNDVRWRPAISELPSLGMRLFEGDFSSAVEPGSATLRLRLDQLARVDANIRRYRWAGARLTIYAGESGDAWPWEPVFKGIVDRFAAEGNGLSLTAIVDTEPFEKDSLTLAYAGTGGLEGGADLKNKVKPWVFGTASNVEPVLINAVDNVFQFSAYGPIKAVTKLYERGSDFGASTGDFADYAALVAANIPAGRWGTCLAQGLVRLGAPPFGVITGDVQGDAPGGVLLTRTGAIIQRVAANAGVSAGLIDTASLNALDAAVPYAIDLVLTEQTSVLDLARRLARPCNAQAGVSWTGKLFTARVAIGAPAITLDAQGRQRPPVCASVENDVSPPYWRIEMGGARSWRVHSLEEIAFTAPLVERGRYDDAETYREGHIVDVADGSRWLYTNPTLTAGNDPVIGSAFWTQISPPSSLSDLEGEVDWSTQVGGDGKPDDNATVGAPPGTPVGTTPSELVEKSVIDSAAAQRQLQRDSGRLAEALVRAVAEADRTRTVMRDAGVTVDAASGVVRIYGIDRQAEQLSDVYFRLSAAESSILLRATTTYVDEKIAQAVLDPSQIADLEDLQIRIGSAELAISGLEASLALKAEALAVTNLQGSVITLQTNYDALAGTVSTKADSTTVTALDSRVSSVEQTITTLGNVTGISVTIRQARFVADDAAESALRALLAGDASTRQRLVEAAQIRSDLTTKIIDGDLAEAAQRLALAARVQSSEAAIVAEQTARATGDSANALAISGLQTTVNGHTATITQHSESINGIQAKVTLTLDVDGRVIGWSIVNGSGFGDMTISADRFLIEDPDLGPVFQVVNGIIAGAKFNWAGVIGSGRPADNADVTNDQPVVQWLDLVTGRAIDSRLLNPNNNFGLRSLADFPTLTWTDNGGSCTLNIGSAVFYPDWGGSITFPAGSVPGIAYGAKVYIWRNQANPSTAGTSWGVSTNLNDALGPGKVYCGAAIAPASAGAPPPPPPPRPGVEDCVQIDAFVPTSTGVKRAEEVAIGDQLVLLDEASMAGTVPGPVEDNFTSEAEAVRLVTASGIALTLSACTPITLRDGRSCRADECLGEPVPVLDCGRFRWERVAWVIPAGTIRVAHIRCHQRTYAAGDAADRYILTHNPAKP